MKKNTQKKIYKFINKYSENKLQNLLSLFIAESEKEIITTEITEAFQLTTKEMLNGSNSNAVAARQIYCYSLFCHGKKSEIKNIKKDDKTIWRYKNKVSELIKAETHSPDYLANIDLIEKYKKIILNIETKINNGKRKTA
jgi:hypothetical protein